MAKRAAVIINPDDEKLHAKVMQAHNSNYWHYFLVVSTDMTAFYPPRFFTEEEATGYLNAVAKENPKLDLEVTHGLALAHRLPGYNLPLEQIKCPHTREFFRAHRERIAALEVK